MAQLTNPQVFPVFSWWQSWMPNHHSRNIVLYGLLALSIAMSSCKDHRWDLIPVQGTITQAGQPLVDVEVSFLPDGEAGTKGPRASSFTDEAGHYELRIGTGDRGAVVGHYRVCLSAPRSQDITPDVKEFKKSRPNKQTKAGRHNPDGNVENHPALNRVPLEYRSFNKTPLRAEVRATGGMQTLDFDIP